MNLQHVAWMALCLPLSGWVVVGGACAGAQVSAAGTGMVTGRVVYADTQRPARFATVTLFGVPTDLKPAPPPLQAGADMEAQMAAMTAAMESVGKASVTTVQTQMDGSFSAANVAPGDYYVFAAGAGYVSPTAVVQSALNENGGDVKKPLAGVPVVHVAGERTSNVELSMQRGAAVSGMVVWDDGSPVTGALVSVVPAKDLPKVPPQFAMLAVGGGMGGLLGALSVSDDLGRFRLAGLAAGEYMVKVTLQTNNGVSMTAGSMNMSKMLAQAPVLIFAPSAFRQTEAKTFSLHTGEDARDIAVTVNLAGLHTVSGKVASAEDHHGLNQATVRLTDASDKTFARAASVDAAGNYTLTFVPSGMYSLMVSDAADTEPEKAAKTEKKASIFAMSTDKTLRSYDDTKLSLTVTDVDVTGQNAELKVSKEVKKDSMGEMMKGLMKE